MPSSLFVPWVPPYGCWRHDSCLGSRNPKLELCLGTSLILLVIGRHDVKGKARTDVSRYLQLDAFGQDLKVGKTTIWCQGTILSVDNEIKKKQICSSKFEDRAYPRVEEIVEFIPMNGQNYKALNLNSATFKHCSKCVYCYHFCLKYKISRLL